MDKKAKAKARRLAAESRPQITAEELRAIATYDSETGLFTWAKTKGRGRQRKGSFDGQGYLQVTVHSKRYQIHRLAWLWVHGEYPSGEIDHANGVRDDNRLRNLRDVTASVNRRNAGPGPGNTSGYKGVNFHKSSGKWRAQLRSAGRHRSLGYYPTPELAHEAYVAGVLKYIGKQEPRELIHGQEATRRDRPTASSARPVPRDRRKGPDRAESYPVRPDSPSAQSMGGQFK